MLPEISENLLEDDFEQSLNMIEDIKTSSTYFIDMESNRIVGKCDGIEAVKQAIYLILNTERYEHMIYSWNYGIELSNLFGKPKSYCIPELQRRITESLTRDDRIESLTDFSFYVEGSKLIITFTANTKYGDTFIEKVVNI